jgi:hypothetical protein
MSFAAADSAVWLGLGTLDWIVLSIYFLVVLAIGIWSYTKVKNMSDFFMGGRRFGKIFMMFFAFGSGTSSEQAVGVVAGTWRAGLAGIWWQFLWLWATPFYWIVAPVLRRMRALTTSDFFEARYGPATATLYSAFGIITSIVFIAAGLYGSGKMVNALTGNELEKVAKQMDVTLPELEVRSERGWFQPGKNSDVELALSTELDKGDDIPAAVRKKFDGNASFNKRHRALSENAKVEVVTAGSEWKIVDSDNDRVYPIKKAVDEKSDDEQSVLRIYSSGWRLMEGYELAILAMTIMFVS